jgi:imidazolonepropionase-like amidohydrolase
VLDSNLVFWRNNPRTREDEKVNQIHAFAGCNVLFQAELNPGRSTLGTNYLWYQAATAVKHGMDRDAAMAALTTVPAKILGVDEMVGSIAVGKDADFVLWTGDPLDINSWVDTVVIRGEVVYRRSEDVQLKRLLEATVEGEE